MTIHQTSLAFVTLALAAIGASQPAAADRNPDQMTAECRSRAAIVLKMREPDVSTKYEGQRVDGTHAINGTGQNNKRTVTFQCSFNKRGTKVLRFVVNKPTSDQAPQSPKAACLATVARQVGVTGGSVVNVTKGKGLTHVLVKVPAGMKLWRCDHNGKSVQRIIYAGQR